MAKSSLEFVELLPHSVIKRFAAAEAFHRELRVYQANLPMVPKLIRFGERDWIEMERIEGQPYLDRDFNSEAAANLAAAIARFHLAWFSEDICLCHWDNQPANLLRSGDAYYFLDFSDSRLAPPEADVSHLLLFWAAEFDLTTTQDLLDGFLAAYQSLIPLDPLRWSKALDQSLERFSRRRKLHSHSGHHTDNGCFNANLLLLRDLIRQPGKIP